jgi:endogenous inhibitor of DNA gyrase (YacG/DUF329 family)
MLPRTIACAECGERAVVRGYGRVQFEWEPCDQGPRQLDIKAIRLTTDCPKCGVSVQDYHPARELVAR